jgi:hypothetical protein
LRLMQGMFLGRAEMGAERIAGWLGRSADSTFRSGGAPAHSSGRLQRLRAREAKRFGADAVVAGGRRHQEMEDFIEWALRYDGGDFTIRSLQKHQAWLAALPCPVCVSMESGR